MPNFPRYHGDPYYTGDDSDYTGPYRTEEEWLRGTKTELERGERTMMKPNAPPPQNRMQLSAVTRGRVEKPMRVLLYGTEGVGKSTFGASAPSPIFLAAEDGTSHLDVARFPEPRGWRDVLDAIQTLTYEQHEYRTLVVDTLDWLEPLVWQYLVESANSPNKIKSIEDFGYGKGYTAALDCWRVFMAALEQLRNKRAMAIVLLAHSQIKTFKNPEDDDYDRYELKLHLKAGGALKEWCDAVLFTRYETFAARDEKTKRVRGASTGARVVHTQRTAAWDAKNRYDLPDTLPLDWTAFMEAVAAGRPAGLLRNQIEALLPRADAETQARVRAAVTKAGDNSTALVRIADKLTAEVNLKAQENG